jgi:hypothetical protein
VEERQTTGVAFDAAMAITAAPPTKDCGGISHMAERQREKQNQFEHLNMPKYTIS